MTEPTHDTDQVRLVRLEETVAHQDQLLGQLNESLTQLRDQHDLLKSQFEIASTKVQWLMENSNPGDDLPHEKPPHY
ncbi:MAG: SlyX family protein [Pirellulaceae bacterium]